MYLNRSDREHYLFMAAMIGDLTMWMDERHPFNRDELKYMRMAKSFIKKAMQALINRVDRDQQERLMQQSRNNYAAILPTKAKEPKENIVVDKEALFELACYPLYFVCKQHDSEKGCMHSDENYKKCELYQTMIQLDIPLANDGRGRGCPYRFED